MLSHHVPQYNGCKWRSQVLRVEVAKPHFLARLQAEWADEQLRVQQEQLAAQAAAQEAAQLQAAAAAGEQDTTVRICVPGSRRKVRWLAALVCCRGMCAQALPPHPAMCLRCVPNQAVVVDLTAKAKSHRAWFPAHKPLRLHELSWEPPPSKR